MRHLSFSFKHTVANKAGTLHLTIQVQAKEFDEPKTNITDRYKVDIDSIHHEEKNLLEELRIAAPDFVEELEEIALIQTMKHFEARKEAA